MKVNTNNSPSYFDGANVTKTQRRMLFLRVIGYFFDQMDNFNFGFIAPALIEFWGLSFKNVAQVASLYFLGMLLGGLTGGAISDVIGRKKMFLLSILFFSLCSVLNGLAPNFNIFLLCRFFTGVGLAGMTVVSMTYISEMAPSEVRGKWQALTLGTGLLAIPLIGIISRIIVPMSPDAWRIIFLIGGLGLTGSIIGIFWLKESPRWLVSKGRLEEANRIIGEIVPGRRLNVDLVENAVAQEKTTLKYLPEMFKGEYLRRTIVLMIGCIFGFPAGFIFVSWAPTMLGTRGFTLEDSLLLGLFIGIGMPIGAYLAFFVIERGGRKIPLVITQLCLAVMALIYGLLENQAYIMASALLISILMNTVVTLFFTYVPESFPTRIRNFASALIWSVGRLSTAAVQIIVPVIYAGYGYFSVFLLMGCMSLIVSTVTAIWGVRTSGKTLEDLNESLAGCKTT